jgi:predicted RND superfamily exporter protein
MSISVTGLSVIAARNSATMIGKLSIGLTLEFLFVAAFMGAAFRSFVVMFAAILPGIFPGVASGAILQATRPAICERRGADSLIWARIERNNPFPQPSAPWRR